MSELGDSRRRARERALEIMYEAAIKGRALPQVVAELAVRPDGYTESLLAAVESHGDRATDLIGEYAIDWPLERIALVDRLIMTLAVSERLMSDGAPSAVILDEAVEMAKTFSGDNSPTFVNGVLGSIFRLLAE